MVATYTYDYTDRRVLKRVWSKTNSPPLQPFNPSTVQPSSVLYPDKYFEVRESDAPVKYVWNGNTRVARVTGSLTTSQRTQRLRVYPGMNLVSLAVTATNALTQLSTFNPQLTAARRWNPGSFAWVNVTASETLAAGTVLWVEMVTNATLTVTGGYAEPANQALQPGVNFVSGWGLQPIKLADALPVSTAAWKYDAPSRRWARRLTGELQTLSDVPAMLAPGDAVFARPEVVGTLTVPESALQVRYYHQDHLGSSSVLTDAAGALVSETANYAFGFARNEFLPRNLREPYGFTQKEQDTETGLSYFESRFLVTRLARFMSVDAKAEEISLSMLKEPSTLNSYSYTENNPLTQTDPDGEASWPVQGNQIVGNKNNKHAGHFGEHARKREGGGHKPHHGADIGAKEGESVAAFKEGKVVKVGYENPKDKNQGHGYRIVVRHEETRNGKKRITYSVYSHLKEDSAKVKAGDKVAEGQKLGEVGRTGNVPKANPTHLHFEVQEGKSYPGKKVNPADEFTLGDKVKTFFKGIVGDGPVAIPETSHEKVSGGKK